MIRSKSRKLPGKDMPIKTKSNIVTRKMSQNIPDYCLPKNTTLTYESSGSQSSHRNNSNKKNQLKSNKGKDEFVPLTINPERRKVNANSTNNMRKKIFPTKSDSSVETPNIVIRQQQQYHHQNRPASAATSQRKKHIQRSEYIAKDKDINEKDFISEENDADNCFQIIKDAIEEVVETTLKRILGTQIPVISQKLEQVYSYIQKNEDDMTNCFKELEARITHYGEDQGRHIRYLCMKLEFDKMIHNHLGNLMVTSSGHSHCCQNNTKTKSYTSCLSHRQQQTQQSQQQQHQPKHQQPQNSCSCCFDNVRRMSMDQTVPTQDSVRCSSARPSTLRGGINGGHYELRQTTDPSSDSNKNTILHQCGDGQQQDLNNKSVLSILEELKKRNSSDMKTSSLLKTNIAQNNNSDEYSNLCNAQNISSDNTTADIGLKDILATIQKYYPIVDQNVMDDIRLANNQNRIDMDIELPITHRSYEE